MYMILALAGPSALVIAMRSFDHFNGWKTNTVGTLLLILGVLQNMDNSMLPADVASWLMTGFGIATVLASQFTNRVTDTVAKNQEPAVTSEDREEK